MVSWSVINKLEFTQTARDAAGVGQGHAPQSGLRQDGANPEPLCDPALLSALASSGFVTPTKRGHGCNGAAERWNVWRTGKPPVSIDSKRSSRRPVGAFASACQVLG